MKPYQTSRNLLVLLPYETWISSPFFTLRLWLAITGPQWRWRSRLLYQFHWATPIQIPLIRYMIETLPSEVWFISPGSPSLGWLGSHPLHSQFSLETWITWLENVTNVLLGSQLWLLGYSHLVNRVAGLHWLRFTTAMGSESLADCGTGRLWSFLSSYVKSMTWGLSG